jgi:phosphatidylserine decarboxylase
MKPLFIYAQHLVPHHLFSRLTGLFASSEVRWWKNLMIERFIATYGVDMSEAAEPDPRAYSCFNTFFTRALKPGARPLAAAANAVLSPADGVVADHAARRRRGKGRTLSQWQLRDGVPIAERLSPRAHSTRRHAAGNDLRARPPVLREPDDR